MTGSNLTTLAAKSASSIVQLFVPLRFKIIFYSKIFFIEPTHDPSTTPNRRPMSPD